MTDQTTTTTTTIRPAFPQPPTATTPAAVPPPLATIIFLSPEQHARLHGLLMDVSEYFAGLSDEISDKGVKTEDDENQRAFAEHFALDATDMLEVLDAVTQRLD